MIRLYQLFLYYETNSTPTKKINVLFLVLGNFSPTQILTLSLTNTIGYVLEGLKIRVVTVEELFEKRPWITNIKELFPFETIEIGYPLEIKEGEPIIANILVEASTETFGKIFSRTFKIPPEG